MEFTFQDDGDGIWSEALSTWTQGAVVRCKQHKSD